MRKVSLREANQRFASCVAEVEAGGRIVLLRRGKPVAEIIPFTDADRRSDAGREHAKKQLVEILNRGMDLGGPFTRSEMHER